MLINTQINKEAVSSILDCAKECREHNNVYGVKRTQYGTVVDINDYKNDRGLDLMNLIYSYSEQEAVEDLKQFDFGTYSEINEEPKYYGLDGFKIYIDEDEEYVLTYKNEPFHKHVVLERIIKGEGMFDQYGEEIPRDLVTIPKIEEVGEEKAQKLLKLNWYLVDGIPYTAYSYAPDILSDEDPIDPELLEKEIVRTTPARYFAEDFS
jgi:hypothetical protein